MSNRLDQRVLVKTANYTINPGTDAAGTRFTNRGAGGNVYLTLPPPKVRYIGLWYVLECEVDHSVRFVANTNGDLCTIGNAAANSVGFESAGNRIGRQLIAKCDGQQWIVIGLGSGFYVNGSQVDAGTGDASVLIGVTAGVAAASKAVVLDAQTALAGLMVALGAGATATKAGGAAASLTDPSTTGSGTVQNTEYTLNSIALPANALSANGKGFLVWAWGTLAANANAKNLKLYLGATAISTTTGSTANAKDFVVIGLVLRTAVGAQIVVTLAWIDTGTSPVMAVSAPAVDETTALTIALKAANTAAAAASGTGKGMAAVFLN